MELLEPLIQSSAENSLSDTNLTCICGAIFKRRSCLKVHLETHTNEKTFVCHYCSKAFRQRTHLDLHIKSHTGEKPYICRTCGKECSTKRSLEIHLNVHTKKKSYKCDICQKTFGHRENLRRHIERHSGIKAYACGVCGKFFTEQPLLTSHMRVHSTDKPYQCDTCGKKFARKQMLQCHIVIHSGVKPYKCEVCPKKFTHWPDAIKHQKIHSGIRPFACHLCSSTFVRRDHLNRHCKIHNKKHNRIETELEKIGLSDNDLNVNQSAAKKEQLIKDNDYKHYKNDVFVKSDQQIIIRENDGYHMNVKSDVNGMYYTTLKNSHQQMASDHKQQTKIFTLNNVTHECDNNIEMLGDNVEVSEIEVKIDDSKIVEIQFVSNDSKDDVVTHNGEEYVEIKSKEELDNVVSNLSEESNVRVLIGIENDQGTWEYEEVETTVEKVVCDAPKKSKRRKGCTANKMSQTESRYQRVHKEIDLDPSAPWKCALCNLGFTEKLKLTEHFRCQHTDFSVLKKYGIKLVINKASGEVEEKALILRHRIKTVSKDELQPVYNKYFSKKRHKTLKKQSLPKSKTVFNNVSKRNAIKRKPNPHEQNTNNLKALINVKKNESVRFAKNISSNLCYTKENLSNKHIDGQNIFNFGTIKCANEDLDIIWDENNYETLQEKQMIRKIQDNDDCFVIIVGDDVGNGDTKHGYKFQLILDMFNVNVDTSGSSNGKNTGTLPERFRECYKKRRKMKSPTDDFEKGDPKVI